MSGGLATSLDHAHSELAGRTAVSRSGRIPVENSPLHQLSIPAAMRFSRHPSTSAALRAGAFDYDEIAIRYRCDGSIRQESTSRARAKKKRPRAKRKRPRAKRRRVPRMRWMPILSAGLVGLLGVIMNGVSLD